MQTMTSCAPVGPYSSSEQAASTQLALILTTAVFFMWGFITCLNDVLIPYLKASFDLNYSQSLLIQFTFFGAYFILGVPAGHLVSRIGYRNSIVTGLLIAALGALLFLPAAKVHIYGLFLGGLFVLAAGITLLQVSANSYVQLLGPERTASSRLNLAQMFNSLGTTIAPWVGGLFILSSALLTPKEQSALAAPELTAYHANQANLVQIPYLILALILTITALIVYFFHPKALANEGAIQNQDNHQHTFKDALKHRHLAYGIVGIFVYVGAEVSIGSLLISYLATPSIGQITASNAAFYVSLYWGGSMVGRLIGSALLRVLHPGKLLGSFAIMAAMLVVTSILSEGNIALWSIVAVGLFNSIMFPTIFSLSTTSLGPVTAKGSSLLIMAIVGGATIPLLQAIVADSSLGLQHSFIVPACCYLFIIFYGFRGSKVDHVHG